MERRETFANTSNQWYDTLIPTTVEEIEKKIKMERELEEIISNGSHDSRPDCWQIRDDILQISNRQKEKRDEEKKSFVELESIPKEPKTRKKSKKQMSFDELKRQKRESNRLAALKCRQKKLSQLDLLEKKSKRLKDENTQIEQQLADLKAQLFQSKMTIINHRTSGCLINAFHN